MKTPIAGLPILAVALFACGTAEESALCATGMDVPGAGVAAPFDGPRLDSAAWTLYGSGVHQGDAVPVAAVLANPEQFSGRPVRMRGPIDAVCQERGCWVRIGGAEDNVLTRFKDSAFFLPKDASGEAIVEGYVSVDTMSVDEVKHYLEDEGKDAEAEQVTEPRTQVRFLAYGVAIAK